VEVVLVEAEAEAEVDGDRDDESDGESDGGSDGEQETEEEIDKKTVEPADSDTDEEMLVLEDRAELAKTDRDGESLGI
jgi:hypothetical protein